MNFPHSNDGNCCKCRDWFETRFYIYILFCFLYSVGYSQNHLVRGRVTDSLRNPLPGTTVVLLHAADSLLYKFTITDTDGEFTFSHIPEDDYILQFSFMGYKNLSRPLKISSGAEEINLGEIELSDRSIRLSEVMVKDDRIPIVFKQDTIEYNAGAYKVKEDDKVEDLLKQLPGVEVSRNGEVKAQGEKVEKVLVDGKEFFGDDPKIATKNLPADAVDKVQVYDKLSDISEFTGIDDGNRMKTINLALKEDKKKGLFGDASAGYGDQDRYAARLNMHRFSDKDQFSLLGNANNINQQAFSIEDYIRFMGGLRNLMSGGQIMISPGDIGMPPGGSLSDGFVTGSAAGINWNHQIGKNTEWFSNYFYHSIRNDVSRTSAKEYYLPGKKYFSEEQGETRDINGNHRLNIQLKQKIDTLQDIQVKAGLRYNDGESDNLTFVRNFSDPDQPESYSDSRYDFSGNGNQINSDLLYRRRFIKNGRSLVSQLTFGKNGNDKNAFLHSDHFTLTGDTLSPWLNSSLKQEQQQSGNTLNYGVRVSYTEPIGKQTYFEMKFAHQEYGKEYKKEFYDILSGDTVMVNPALSNAYKNRFHYDKATVNILLNQKKYNLIAGAGVQYSGLEGKIPEDDSGVNRKFLNVLPGFQFHYRFSTHKHFQLDYETAVKEPPAEQMHPVVINSDPMNIFTGNPNLKPEYSHALRSSYMSFSQFSFTSFFVFLQTTLTEQKISSSVTTDSLLMKRTMPVNVDHDLSVRLSSSFSTPLRFMKAKINADGNSTYANGITLINEAENQTGQFINSLDVSLENWKKEKTDMMAGYSLSHNLTRYSVNPDHNNEFFTQNYYVELSRDLSKRITFETDFNYTIYSSSSFARKEAFLWNASLKMYFLKNNKGQVVLSVTDILNQNTGISRNALQNYSEDERIQTLGRYFMLTFSYSISGFSSQSDSGIEINVK